MDQGIIACDSKQHIRHGKSGKFRGLIGVTLGIRKPTNFRKQYDQILKSFFKQSKKARKKKVYKSSEIGSLFPGRRENIMKAYRNLARSFIRLPDVDINVYYLTLDLEELRARIVKEDPQKTKDLILQGEKAELLTIYGEKGREGAKQVSITEFFSKVREYFPIVCAWKLCSFLGLWNAEVVLDGCKGEKSYAWEELVSNCATVSIAFNGGLYNPFISACDIIVKWIDEELRGSGLPLNMNALIRVLREWNGVTEDLNTEHVHIVHLSNKDLKDIQPLSKEKIDAFEYLYARHPILFIFREEANEKQRKEIESSPRMNRILDLVYAKDGSLLWWDPRLYPSIISKGDVAIIFGPTALQEAEFMVRAGKYPLTIIKAEDIE